MASKSKGESKSEGERQIAVVVYPGLTLLDLIGTVSALSGLGMKTGLRTVTVGTRQAPTETDTPMRVIPQATFDDVPHPFGVIVPGGAGACAIAAMGDERLVAYVRAAAATAEVVGSVGSGALILAAAGLLAGRQATTHWAYRRILENLGATYVPRRWVEDGKLITAAGTSGGIDMALHLVAKYRDRRSARQVQLWIEYDPQPPFGPLDQRAIDEDEDALAPTLARHQAELERALAHRPDLLAAVLSAGRPAEQVGVEA